jgi:predicted secreted protein
MSTNARIGYGTLFASGNGASPEVFTDLAEVTNITPPGWARDTVDATHQQSPGAHREFIAALADAGELSIDINYVPGGAAVASLEAEKALTGSSAAKNRRITFPDGSYMTFVGILTAFEPDAPIDDKMAASLTFKVSGVPTFVQA